jgi:Flp pilus assembly protein TadG
MRTTPAHRSCRRRGRQGESGQIFVWTSFLLPILLIAAGLTFDVGNMVNIRDELTSSVDAAALAAAEGLHDTKASESYVRNTAKNVAAENDVPSLGKNAKGNAVTLDLNNTNAAGGDIVLGKYDFTTKTFTRAAPVNLSEVNAVQVNARLSKVAGSLPLAFGAMVGLKTYDTVRTAMAVIGAPVQVKANAPLVVDKNVFTGKTKGFTAPDDIILSTKVAADMMWTGFFNASNASNVAGYIAAPAGIPDLKIGDVINTTTANEGANYHGMKDLFPPNSIMILPVVDFANADKSKTTATVVGFVPIKVDKIVDTGSPKYLDGTVLNLKTGSGNPTTIAECFGLDCRSFLVN